MKRFIILMLALIMALSLCACGGTPSGDGRKEKPFDKEIVLVDNDDVRFVITGKFQVVGEYEYERAGYTFEMEDKSSAKYYSMSFDNTSVNGYMVPILFDGISGQCAPGKKTKGDINIQFCDIDIKGMDDLEKVDGYLRFFANYVGDSSTYLEEFKVPFELD